jgi:ribose 1,5-bisphosphokinase PhnN
LDKLYEQMERGREARNDAVLRVARERAQRQRDEDAVQIEVALRRG